MPNSAIRLRILIATTLLAGAGDLFTGLLLIFAPEWTLSLMKIPAVRDPVFIGFIGCFVSAVGFSYLWGLAAWSFTGSVQRLRSVWELTMIFRFAVGSFVIVHILNHTLSPSWLSVPIADWFWVIVQALLIWAGIFRVVEG